MRWFWIDRFTEYVAGSHATGLKGISLADNYMHDHWDVYPIMPNSLIAEGMAQTGGLLVSELYKFQELVVLAKFSSLEFNGEVRGGDQLTYRSKITGIRDAGAMVEVTGHVGERQHASAEIFFARLQKELSTPENPLPERLFDPKDLTHWLHLTGIFEVGVRQDGTRLQASDYNLPTIGADATLADWS